MGVFDEIWAVSFTWVFHSYGWRKIGKDRKDCKKRDCFPVYAAQCSVMTCSILTH